ncbi:sensor histidine kinase [Deminuibacter soli]|nr:sensor histidine kinase [Deminuibacter soli]
MLPFAFLFPSNSKISPFESQRFIWMLISSNIILITFYYLNRWWLIPRLLARKQTLVYIAAVIAYLLLYLGVMFFIFVDSPETKAWLLSQLQKNPNFKFKPRFFGPGPLTLFLLTFIISSSSKVIAQWFYAEETRQEITKQQLQTELSLLKSQVNPHFLFNTLNSIYSLSITNSEKTSDAVMKLSRIMRYTLEESKNDEVPLADEIEFIRSYIDLQKIRLTDMVRIDFTTEGELENTLISPLLFIPFIENAFKYGISTHHPSHISIFIAVQQHELIFTCVNDIVPVSLKHESTGTGIVNTRRRLELLYPGKHTLSIESNTRQYNVLLRLNMNV